MKMNKLITVFLFVGMVFYYPAWGQNENYTETGMASYYGDKFEGKTTANGEKYFHAKMTAAHPTLPFGTIVKVTNLENDKTVAVRINDRGPFKDKRIIDLSKSAAEELDFMNAGLTKVKLVVISSLDKAFGEPGKANPPTMLYNLQMEKIAVKNQYAVQLASYSRMQNLLKAIERIDKKDRSRYYFEVVQKNNGEFFRLFFGLFSNENAARRSQNQLSHQFRGCFVTSF